jgi:hypothetical protein
VERVPEMEKVISWLEGLAEPDWRVFHSDSEVQNIAKYAIALLKEDCHNCKLECLLQKYDEQKEKYDALLKEQEHKDKMFHALEEDWKRLKDQEETELCDRCGRRRLKSNREGGNNER